ncbi:hypothetical protein BKA57DRAFT_468603 [Linnemannia elongata]|nr:hypothetical protein BKA57DRAFT_468603 [Linnemannia elongata]
MNSSDIPPFLPSFLFSCWVCFCCIFPIPIQADFNTPSLTTDVTTIHCLIRFPLALSFFTFVASSHH